MAKKTEEFDYRAKSEELDDVLDKLQDPDIQVDEATELYKKGQDLLAELEAYLEEAETIVRAHTSES